MNVRRYRTGEEDELWRLRSDTTRIVIGKDYTEAQVRRWAPDQIEPDWSEKIRQKNPFVAEHDGQIVGFAELEADGHINDFYCHHQWQRRGVGTSLQVAVEQEAHRLGIGTLFLESSVTAHRFFLNQGFEITETKDNLICGSLARQYIMRKSLVPGASASRDQG